MLLWNRRPVYRSDLYLYKQINPWEDLGADRRLSRQIYIQPISFFFIFKTERVQDSELLSVLVLRGKNVICILQRSVSAVCYQSFSVSDSREDSKKVAEKVTGEVKTTTRRRCESILRHSLWLVHNWVSLSFLGRRGLPIVPHFYLPSCTTIDSRCFYMRLRLFLLALLISFLRSLRSFIHSVRSFHSLSVLNSCSLVMGYPKCAPSLIHSCIVAFSFLLFSSFLSVFFLSSFFRSFSVILSFMWPLFFVYLLVGFFLFFFISNFFILSFFFNPSFSLFFHTTFFISFFINSFFLSFSLSFFLSRFFFFISFFFSFFLLALFFYSLLLYHLLKSFSLTSSSV